MQPQNRLAIQTYQALPHHYLFEFPPGVQNRISLQASHAEYGISIVCPLWAERAGGGFEEPRLKTVFAFPPSPLVTMEMIKMPYHGMQPSRAREPLQK